jgi:hypothetical protein
MYDAKYIIPGLVIFLLLILMPYWWTWALGAGEAPVLEPLEGQCVLEGGQMKGEHMQILDDWRDEVVRDGERYYLHPDGETREKSLTNTCLGCHGDKTQFCDKCHDYAGVDPYCWDCHNIPEVQ